MRTTVVYAVATSLAFVGTAPVWAASTVLGLPLSFEPNRGQSDPAVQFVSHGISGTRYTLFLTREGAVLGFGASDKDHGGAVVSMKLAGARPVRGSGTNALAGKVNYFLGNDPTKWIRGIPTYSRIHYALNKKTYAAITASLCVTDVKVAASFYQKAFGFEKRGIMNGPDGKPMHAELTIRGITIMLGPEMPEMGARSAKKVGASPTTLYLLVEDVDKVFAKAVKLGATPQGPVADMFWGDRCGRLVDPEGYTW